MPRNIKLLQTGIFKLDDLTDGILTGSSVLLFGIAGIDKATFAQHIAFEQLKQGKECLYFVINKLPRIVKENMKRVGWDISKFEKNLIFIDCFSSLIGLKSREKYVVEKPKDMESISKIMKEVVKSEKNELFIFDSLSSLVTLHGNQVLDRIVSWIKLRKKHTLASIFIFTNWNFEPKFVEEVKSIFDYVINLKAVEEKVLLRNYFSIDKAPIEVPKVIIPFRIAHGGVVGYVPKILVTGPFHAGKSSFIHAISTKAVSVDRLGTTIALDHGYIEHSGLSAEIFGTPGQKHFDFMLELLSKDAFGVILIVDSTQPESFPRAIEMIEKTKLHGIPFVIAANKQDLPGAFKPTEIRKVMKLSNEIPVIPCVATKKQGCFDAFKTLFDIIVSKSEVYNA